MRSVVSFRSALLQVFMIIMRFYGHLKEGGVLERRRAFPLTTWRLCFATRVIRSFSETSDANRAQGCTATVPVVVDSALEVTVAVGMAGPSKAA